ncbi:hypothetical protein NIE88_21715 [Sporolactobacillus shoreicorticis]|uniref:Uncharacterized protein n=1 Tax=Sporolactobacillus shoreicorticis TaxID=1923877 RepID=A0ABW5S8V4_9BACL|nr:hypothetical protein [Sporolactobacillus shoreicorticis]MCO7128345.1 hypothetical protein [Sporolactobacillus shoreicorticis]
MTKKFLKIIVTFSLLLTVFSFYNFKDAHAENSDPSQHIINNYTSEPTKEEIVESGYIIVDGEPSENSPSQFHTLIAIPVGSDYGHTWKYVSTYKGDSKTTDKITELVKRLSVAVIPLVPKGISTQVKTLISVVSQPLFDTFYNPPKTQYYTTKYYYDEDYYHVYSKIVLKVYSNKSRTKLIKTKTAYSQNIKRH